MATKEQKWAQDRNLGKARLKGCAVQIGNMSKAVWVSQPEADELNTAYQHLRWVLEKWESQNAVSKARMLANDPN